MLRIAKILIVGNEMRKSNPAARVASWSLWESEAAQPQYSGSRDSEHSWDEAFLLHSKLPLCWNVLESRHEADWA